MGLNRREPTPPGGDFRANFSLLEDRFGHVTICEDRIESFTFLALLGGGAGKYHGQIYSRFENCSMKRQEIGPPRDALHIALVRTSRRHAKTSRPALVHACKKLHVADGRRACVASTRLKCHTRHHHPHHA